MATPSAPLHFGMLNASAPSLEQQPLTRRQQVRSLPPVDPNGAVVHPVEENFNLFHIRELNNGYGITGSYPNTQQVTHNRK